MDWLIQIDRELFRLINDVHSASLDPVISVISGKWTWIPLYALLLFMIGKKFGWQSAGIALLCIVPTIAASDFIASGIFKPWFARLRPCQAESFFAGNVHILEGYCGGKFGFVSSHSANFFALATFLWIGFRKTLVWMPLSVFISAGIVAYSRVYAGVHYPADVFAGALLGIVVGFCGGWGYHIAEKKLRKRQSA